MAVAPALVTPAVQAPILRGTLQDPRDGSTHWACRNPALTLDLSRSNVHRVWSQAQLKPHRLDRHMASNGPEFSTQRHISAELIEFSSGVVRQTEWAKEIHIVLDHLRTHKPEAVEQFLEHNQRVRFHFTPTYSSWLNPVELRFAKSQRDVIDRGAFTAVTDLARKLRRYICAYEKSACPVRRTFTNPQPRILPNQA
jgi:transposase